MNIDLRKAAMAGVAGTAVMTMVGLWGAPMMGMSRMNPAEMLAGAMGGSLTLGWLAHFMIGVILAAGYAVAAPPGLNRPPARGCRQPPVTGLTSQVRSLSRRYPDD